jgi:flagellar hook-associated protein 1 FlgK
MSITSAINSSRSGLLANSRRAEIVSSNIANAQNENYSRRSLNVTTAPTSGVQVVGLKHEVNTAMDGLYRDENSRFERQSYTANVLSVHAQNMGDVDSEYGIPNQMNAFRDSLTLLANAPGDASLQRDVLAKAQQLTYAIKDAHESVTLIKRETQNSLDADIKETNDLLARIEKTNDDIMRSVEGTATRATLQDRLRADIDSLSSKIGIVTQYGADGEATVFTSGGNVLVGSGDTNYLSYNSTTGELLAGDVDITPGSAGRRAFSEGSIAGQMNMLTETVPQMQLQLDEIARGLIQGFENADTSLTSGQAGLFTDAGSAYSASAPSGLAGRIAINDAVDPQKGGALTRLRDGVGATVVGPNSDSTQVIGFADVFSTTMSFDANAGLGTSDQLGNFAVNVVSAHQTLRVEAQTQSDLLATTRETYHSARLNMTGVNLDDELQQLTMIEQSYAANSQVLRVVSEMIETLLNAV